MKKENAKFEIELIKQKDMMAKMEGIISGKMKGKEAKLIERLKMQNLELEVK